ncbi:MULTISPECIES: UPF0175 family protein [unclassified Acinetobacter]|uniref:UPF0175 family protein n=1 Tax=unclassified Acinetobacter TaxID=196816 RepID=UPI0035BAA043
MEISIHVPDTISQQMTQADIEQAFKLSFIVKQYRQGKVTLKQAHTWLDISEQAFLLACHERGVSRQTYIDTDDLLDEFARIGQQYHKKKIPINFQNIIEFSLTFLFHFFK